MEIASLFIEGISKMNISKNDFNYELTDKDDDEEVIENTEDL
jgi:hypothetical protein